MSAAAHKPFGLLAKLSLALVATCVALFLCETLVRAFELAPRLIPIEIDEPYGQFISSRNPVLKYVPKPGSGDINAYGLRDRDYSIKKPGDVFRIVVLGDSIAFGYCDGDELLPVDSLFTEVLERNLNQRSFPGIREVEVINLSVSGYDSRQEVAYLEHKGTALSPDLVMVAYCLNDNRNASTELVSLEEDSSWQQWEEVKYLYRDVYVRVHLLRFVAYRWGLLATRWSHNAKNDATGGALPQGLDFQPDDRTDRAFARLAELGRDHGFKSVVAVFPYMTDYDTYPDFPEHLYVAGAAERHGHIVFDLLKAFRDSARDDPEYPSRGCDTLHPNSDGHAVAAKALEGFLLDQHLLE